jgi:hypothetical protein
MCTSWRTHCRLQVDFHRVYTNLKRANTKQNAAVGKELLYWHVTEPRIRFPRSRCNWFSSCTRIPLKPTRGHDTCWRRILSACSRASSSCWRRRGLRNLQKAKLQRAISATGTSAHQPGSFTVLEFKYTCTSPQTPMFTLTVPQFPLYADGSPAHIILTVPLLQLQNFDMKLAQSSTFITTRHLIVNTSSSTWALCQKDETLI